MSDGAPTPSAPAATSQEAPSPGPSAWKPKSERERESRDAPGREDAGASAGQTLRGLSRAEGNPTLMARQTGPTLRGCGDLFPGSTRDELAGRGLELNPDHLSDATLTTGPKTHAADLTSLAEERLDFVCFWSHPTPTSNDEPPVTSVMRGLDASERERAIGSFAAEGYVCLDADGGMRCTTEAESGGVPNGVSAFLRDDIWLHTEWGGTPPTSYTPRMVAQIWG
ncbi:hypothetical protein [Leucobacter sp. M11]|uniref:hypothetical protein n=1 Tax=Leucobacter sp. M11 TaxID=2993565 RepID=UPI002D7F1715|nr:hypothetical protein [Leucobacter sp. M11]MEB4614059.1 hypothetical protein [Leucobacter sp. M11]